VQSLSQWNKSATLPTKNDSVRATQTLTPLALSKISEKSQVLLNAIHSQRCATQRTAQGAQHCTFANTAVMSRQGVDLATSPDHFRTTAADPLTLSLIEQLNEKMDEIFTQLVSCLETYDNGSKSRLAGLEEQMEPLRSMIERVGEEIGTKATKFEKEIQEMTVSLTLKSNKASVAAALHRKGNKKEVDESLKSLEL
jgi:hypothetical protein